MPKYVSLQWPAVLLGFSCGNGILCGQAKYLCGPLKVFVCSIQKYLCNPFKIAFHQAWQEEGCKNIANSAKKIRQKLIRPSSAWIISNMGQNRWIHHLFHFLQRFLWFVDQKSCICNIFLPLLPLILCEKNLVGIMRAFVALREFLWDKISED